MARKEDRKEGAKWYTAAQVMEPSFRLVAGVTADELDYRDLFIQTFVRDTEEPSRWASTPESGWHHLARVFLKQIITYPVFANPHTQRYLDPRHGRFKTVIYERESGHSLPDDAVSAISDIELACPWRTSNPCLYGLGLIKELDDVWRGLMRIPELRTIIVSKGGALRIEADAVRIPEGEISQMRRDFGRANRKIRDGFRQLKESHVRNVLLARLDPDRFPRIVQVGPPGQLVEVRLDRGQQRKATATAERTATVRAVRSNLKTLAAESPIELVELHAEIERATLAQMIGKFEEMLKKDLPERSWQTFFERNVFILAMAFARPVRLLHSQFYAQGSGLDGKGAQIGDFLLAEQGFAMALVEIKKPGSPLLRRSAYRNRDVFAPDEELSGAVSQVLYQKSMFHENWLLHRTRPELQNSRPDAITCVVISGMLPNDEMQRRSFEVFRNACKNVEVITFDELLGKLRLLSEHLAPHEQPQVARRDNDVPF